MSAIRDHLDDDTASKLTQLPKTEAAQRADEHNQTVLDRQIAERLEHLDTTGYINQSWPRIPMKTRARLRVGPTTMREFRVCAVLHATQCSRLIGVAPPAWGGIERGDIKLSPTMQARIGAVIRSYMEDGEILQRDWDQTEGQRRGLKAAETRRRMKAGEVFRQQDSIAPATRTIAIGVASALAGALVGSGIWALIR